MERELREAGLDETAQYAVAMAYRIRFVMQMNGREAMHLTELRSQTAGPSRRTAAWRRQMHRQIAGVHPTIGAAFTYVSYEDVDLERLEAERRTEEKRKAQAHPSASGLGAISGLTDALRWCRSGEVTWAVGATHADDPVSGSIFYVGSIAKQFVAACIALLDVTSCSRRRSRQRPTYRTSGAVVKGHDRSRGASRRESSWRFPEDRCAEERAGGGSLEQDRAAASDSIWGRATAIRPAATSCWPRSWPRLGFSMRDFARDRILKPLRHAREVRGDRRDTRCRRTPSEGHFRAARRDRSAKSGPGARGGARYCGPRGDWCAGSQLRRGPAHRRLAAPTAHATGSRRRPANPLRVGLSVRTHGDLPIVGHGGLPGLGDGDGALATERTSDRARER